MVFLRRLLPPERGYVVQKHIDDDHRSGITGQCPLRMRYPNFLSTDAGRMSLDADDDADEESNVQRTKQEHDLLG